jgi:hypothetical protein
MKHCGTAATVVANFCHAHFSDTNHGKSGTATGVVNGINFNTEQFRHIRRAVENIARFAGTG